MSDDYEIHPPPNMDLETRRFLNGVFLQLRIITLQVEVALIALRAGNVDKLDEARAAISKAGEEYEAMVRELLEPPSGGI